MLTKEIILEQEQETVLPRFSRHDAWTLGNLIRQLAGENQENISISIQHGEHLVFFSAGNNTSIDNENWIRRKRNVVKRHDHASYFIRFNFNEDEERYYRDIGVTKADYAIHGGGFPIRVTGVGSVGNAIVSGLTSEEDHMLCVNGLLELKKILHN